MALQLFEFCFNSNTYSNSIIHVYYYFIFTQVHAHHANNKVYYNNLTFALALPCTIINSTYTQGFKPTIVYMVYVYRPHDLYETDSSPCAHTGVNQNLIAGGKILYITSYTFVFKGVTRIIP